MNILFLNSIGAGVWGGGEKWMLTAALGLRARDHAILFCGRPGSTLLRRCAEARIETVPLAIRGDFDPVTIWRLRGILTRARIDVVIANFNKDVRLAGLAARLGTSAIVIARNGLPIVPNSGRHRLIYRHLVSGIITNTAAIKGRYLAYGWMDEAFITVIHNGIDAAQPIRFGRTETLERHSIPEGRPIVGIFGRLVGQKQHDRFLDAAAAIAVAIPDAVFLIVGDGPLRAELTRRVDRLGLADNVRFLGFHRDVMPLLSICDLVLLTSKKEGLPNAVQEAMLAGRAVVAFDVGGVRDLIPDSRYGIVVPPDDVGAMADEAIGLLRSPARREALGSAARERIATEFSLDGMIARLEAELRGRMESRPR